MPTRRANRLRAAHADANAATPGAAQNTPSAQIAPVVAEVAPASVVDTAPVVTSRRARRLAAAGIPSAQPMTAPAEIIVEPAAAVPVDSALPVDSMQLVAELADPARPAVDDTVFDRSVLDDSVLDRSVLDGSAPVAAAFGRAAAPSPKGIDPVATAASVAPLAPAAPVAPAVSAVKAEESATDIAAAFGRTAAPAPEKIQPEAKVSAPAPKPAAGAQMSDDAFSLASEAFGFTASDFDDDATIAPDVPASDEPVVDGAAPAHVAPRRPRRMLRRFATAGASLGVMGVAGLIAVSMTLPVSAVAASQGVDARTSASIVATEDQPSAKVADDEIQAFVASSDVEGEVLARSDEFSTVSLSQVAAEEGIHFSESLYTNDPDAAIQWPFIVGVAMSSPYGPRWGRLHAGIDLVPGRGAPIQAIADGVVVKATESGGAYGVNVYIDHVIDGQKVTSHYAHMLYGSLKVQAGQKVKVGDIIGNVGNTGRSYGAHLHFEIIVNGAPIDPLPWMRKNAGRYEY